MAIILSFIVTLFIVGYVFQVMRSLYYYFVYPELFNEFTNKFGFNEFAKELKKLAKMEPELRNAYYEEHILKRLEEPESKEPEIIEIDLNNEIINPNKLGDRGKRSGGISYFKTSSTHKTTRFK